MVCYSMVMIKAHALTIHVHAILCEVLLTKVILIKNTSMTNYFVTTMYMYIDIIHNHSLNNLV